MRQTRMITALYERLSRDDFGIVEGRSVRAIPCPTKRQLLEDYAKQHGFTNPLSTLRTMA